MGDTWALESCTKNHTSVGMDLERTVYSFSRTAVTKHRRPDGLKHRPLFSHSPGDQKSEIKASADSLSLPGLQTAIFWMCPHRVFLLLVCPPLVSKFPSYKDASQIELEPVLREPGFTFITV